MKKLLILFSLAVGGCVTDSSQTPTGPIEYRQGYAPGCDSGYVAAGHPYYKFKKDVMRYAQDPLYRQGWNDGFAVCKGQYDSYN